MTDALRIRLGTRKSPLALWQAHWVRDELNKLGAEVEIVHIVTQGDVAQGPLGQVGVEGLFTKEIQRALLDGRADLAVHSLKDLPTETVDGLQLSAVPPRESTGDCLVTRDGATIDQLALGAKVGTGSMRRQAQLLHLRPDLKMHDIRGNVDTRLRQLDDGDYDAIILAEAGLRRLEFHERIQHVLPQMMVYPAVGQGALGLETRTDDAVLREFLTGIDHAATHASVRAERAMLSALRGGCLAPVGSLTKVENETLMISGVVLDAKGQHRLVAQETGALQNADELGKQVAEQLIAEGAAELIESCRE